MAIVIRNLHDGYQAVTSVARTTVQKTKETYASSVALIEKYGPLAARFAKFALYVYASNLLFASFGTLSSKFGNETVKKIGSSTITQNLFDLVKSSFIPSFLQDAYAYLSHPPNKPDSQSEQPMVQPPVVIVQQPAVNSSDSALAHRVSALENQLGSISSQPVASPLNQNQVASFHDLQESDSASSSLLPPPAATLLPSPAEALSAAHTSLSSKSADPASSSFAAEYIASLPPSLHSQSSVGAVDNASHCMHLENQIEQLRRQLSENQKKFETETEATAIHHQNLQDQNTTLTAQLEQTEAWSESLEIALKEKESIRLDQQEQISRLEARVSTLQQALTNLKQVIHLSKI